MVCSEAATHLILSTVANNDKERSMLLLNSIFNESSDTAVNLLSNELTHGCPEAKLTLNRTKVDFVFFRAGRRWGAVGFFPAPEILEYVSIWMKSTILDTKVGNENALRRKT
jgi:hypothetical protein